MSKFSLRQAQMIYALSIITGIISFFSCFLDMYVKINELIYFHFSITFLYFLAAYLAKKGKLKISRVLYFLSLNTSILTTASYIGQEGGVEFLFMFSMSLPFMVFSFKREKFLIFLFSLIPILLWTALYLTDFNLISISKIEDLNMIKLTYPASIILTLSLTTFQLMYFSHLNFHDYSTIHTKREDAIEASNAKSKFLSTMSHEIRTPLNAIIGLSHILSDNKPRKNQIENIDALNYSGKILLNLLNNVLDFSKMQSTTIELDNIPTDLISVTKQIKKVHEASCIRKGIEIKLEIDNDLPLVLLDIVRYNQVINNLIVNAIKFTDKGSVTLKIKKQNQTENTIDLLTEIIDTGIGIPKDKQDTIWEAFTQASSSTSRLYGGTGLGLPIVKSIVEIMGSQVKIDSEIGKGSRFYFNINLKLASEQKLQQTDEKKNHNFNGAKILLVEDNLINVMVGKQILEKANLNVTVANDGLTAVNMVKANHFDAILMDIQMPIMDGYTATIEIRKFNKEIPILALSASIFLEVKDKINSSGMNGFIFKPFDPQDLLNQIEHVVNKK